MTNSNPILHAFNAGEFAPIMRARTDLDKYKWGANKIENFWILPQGSLIRRSGSRYVYPVKDEAKKSRLESWLFSTDDAYVLEFSEFAIRFFVNESVLSAPTVDFVDGDVTVADPAVITQVDHRYVDEQGPFRLTTTTTLPTGFELATSYYIVLVTEDTFSLSLTAGGSGVEVTGAAAGGTHTIAPHGVVPHEVTTTYAEADLFQLQFEQSADFLYITHQDYKPATLKRFDSQDWVLTTDGVYKDGPYLADNDFDETGTTLDPAADTGAGIELLANQLTGINDDEGFAATDVGRHVRLTWTDRTGWAIIATHNDADDVDIDIQKDFNTTNASENWRLGAFSANPLVGYPAAVGFYEQRLCFAGTKGQPDTFFGSESGDFSSFSPTTITTGEDDAEVNDSNGLNFTMAVGELNQVFWMTALQSMILGTAGGLYKVDSGTSTSALTPTNVRARLVTKFGSRQVAPVVVGSEVCYATSLGRRLYSLRYDVSIENFAASDLTVVAPHILKSGAVQIAYAQEPHSIVFVPRVDGQMAALTLLREQSVWGWTRQIVGGSFGSGNAVVESVAVIPDPNETHHQAWLVVKRTVNSNTRRYIEFIEQDFTDDDDIEDAFFVDSGVTILTPTATVSGLDHLEGETVDVLVDGVVQAGKTVAGGFVTLDPISMRVAHAGLPYNSDLETLNLEVSSQTGTGIQAKKQRVYRASVRFDTTKGGKIGRDADNLDVIAGTASALFTGDAASNTNQNYSSGSTLYVRQDLPLPMTIVGIMPELAAADRA